MKATLYNKNYTTPPSITDEVYSSVGSSAFILGDYKRYFKGSSDLIIRTASGGGGTLLVENTDYTLTLSSSLTNEAGFNVYDTITITTGAYQSVDLYISYKVIGSLIDADLLNMIITGNLVPPGSITPFGGSSAPTGYLLCDGSAVSRTTYASLFSVIGTTWGIGNGSTTFNVPDLRGAFLRGAGSHGTEQMANGNYFAGGSVGDFEDDQFQSFDAKFTGSTSGTHVVNGQSATTTQNDGSTSPADLKLQFVTDGTNGTPRTGDETRPFNASVNYIIKV